MWWVVMHVVGTVFGVGAATVNDLLFMRAIGNPEEGEAYRRYNASLSLLAWAGVLLIAISAVAFWLTHPQIHSSQKILTKIGLTIVVALNGLVMNVVLRPRLQALQPVDWTKRSKLTWAAGSGAVLGAISIVTWYTLLTLGAVGRVNWTATQIVPIYLAAVVVAALLGSFMIHRRLKALTT